MLGAKVEDVADLRWPLLASPKLDGIRAIWWEGQFYSRKMKPIPNQAITLAMQEFEDKAGGMYHAGLNGLDGELVCGDPCNKLCFNTTTSVVMTRTAPATNLRFYVFDRVDMNLSFARRYQSMPDTLPPFVYILNQELVRNSEALESFENHAVNLGYEGVILRNPEGHYKQGRSTLKEQGLLKLKRFEDDEALVIGFEELMHNDNEAKIDERGYTKRSSHKANKVPMNTLGALIVVWKGVQFNIGSGFTAGMRAEIWKNQKYYLGKQAKFKYLPVGLLEAPRHPVFLGWRED